MLTSYRTSLYSLAILVTVTLALPTNPSKPLPPSQDPWYSAPGGWESTSPGHVLRVRTAPGNLTTVFSNSSAAYNILYRSTNSRYLPSWAVTTLFVPKHSDGSALLSYQIPYNTADVDGSPSYALHDSAFYTGIIKSDIQTTLGLGWYVNVPDFEGPLASFGAGVQEGHTTIDSVRAVLNHGFGLAKDAAYAMWGYSGGSIATEWAAELQVQYAPELHFAGLAAGGLVSNVTSFIREVDSTIWAGLLPEALLGLTTQYPKAREYLLSELKPTGRHNKTAFLAAQTYSIDEALGIYANQSIAAYFKSGERFFDAPVIQHMLDHDGYMGYHGVPEMPLFFYKAVADELTPIQDTDEQVERYCGIGANLLYERNTIGGHLAEESNGDKRALQWLSKVLGGTYDHHGCTIKNVAINVTDSPL